MTLELHLAFVAATIALIALPGPNVALIVANSVAYGWRFGLLTVAGTSAAMVPQLILTVLGMTGMLMLAGHLFEWVRWAGVAYLIYLGVQAWRAPAVDLTKVKPELRSARSIFLRGFLVSLTNPKTLLFYGAFFPQFVTPETNLGAQLAHISADRRCPRLLLGAAREQPSRTPRYPRIPTQSPDWRLLHRRRCWAGKCETRKLGQNQTVYTGGKVLLRVASVRKRTGTFRPKAPFAALPIEKARRLSAGPFP